MTPPDLSRPAARIALCVVAATIAIGCGRGGTDGGSDNPGTDASTHSVAADYGARTEHTAEASAPTVTAGAVDRSSDAAVMVSGGDLPADVADAYRVGGGDLVDPAEWTARYGPTSLPTLSGPGVQLAEATMRAERTAGGWHRLDEASWLVMSTVDRDDLLADVAVAAGLNGGGGQTEGVDNGADCVLVTYPVDPHGVTWTVQGCSYPRYPRMLAVGISRAGPTTGPPAAIDPTLTPVTELLGGQVRAVEVRLVPPGVDNATLRLSAHVELPDDLAVDAASTTVAAGPLVGWRMLGGQDSVLLSGPTGATWTLAAGVAVFDWAGRW